MIAGDFHIRQLFSIDTTVILIKGETGLNHFTISVDKYHSYKVNKVNIVVSAYESSGNHY